MSGIVVFIGYLFLVPSMIGVVIGLATAVGSGAVGESQKAEMLREETQALMAMGVPQASAEVIANPDADASAAINSLHEALRSDVVYKRQLILAGETGTQIGVGLGAMAGIGIALSSLVGGLIGWLLIMKKMVLMCTDCGATVAAS